MKFIILATLFGLSLAAPQARPRSEEPIQILRSENVNTGDGNYNFGYETENGISAGETGVLRTRGAEDPVIDVQGFFQYPSPEGQQFRVDYNAGEQGFVATGDHLPTPPPIPEAIMKALAIIYANADKQKRSSQPRY